MEGVVDEALADGVAKRGMNRKQLKRLQEFWEENQRLRKTAPDLGLDEMILAEATKGRRLKPFASPPMYSPGAAGSWCLGVLRRSRPWLAQPHVGKFPRGRSDQERLTEDITILA